MRKSHEADNHSICSTANQRKRGLARFSLRRLLYSSPLVARRITRGSSNTSKNSRNTGMYSYISGCWGVDFDVHSVGTFSFKIFDYWSEI